MRAFLHSGDIVFQCPPNIHPMSTLCTFVESIRTFSIEKDEALLETLKSIQEITNAIERSDKEAEIETQKRAA